MKIRKHFLFFKTKLFNLLKNKKQKRLLLSLYAFVAVIFLICLLCIIIPSFYKTSYSRLLSYSVLTIPKNLDPQTASSPDEISIINNTFEGLYKQNSNNTYSLAAASSVQCNPEKTRFLFLIKNDRFWSLKSENKLKKQKFQQRLSAADFEFAFKRLLFPKTNSPFAQNYYFIKNAQLVNEGKLNTNSLGVKAYGNQLLIELEHPIPNLEEMLSLAPAMPCNENFFAHTKGRYGLRIDTIMCNGKFYIHYWPHNQKDKKLRLRLNDMHPESRNIKILGVNLSQRPQNETLKLIKKNEIDSAFFDNSEIELGNLELNNSIKFQNSTSGIIFNQKSELFKNEKIRQALALTIDRQQIKNFLNPNKTTIAENIIPNSVTIAGKNIQNLKNSKSNCPAFDLEKAQKLFNEGINELKPKSKPKTKKDTKKSADLNLNKFSILVTKNHYNILNKILQNWQQNLNLYLKTEICDDETYLKNLKNHNFDCTFINIENEFNNPNYILSKFLPESPFNFANIQIPTLKQTLNNASSATTLTDMVRYYEQAEQEILNSASFIPIHHPIKTFVYNKNFNNITLIKSCKQLIFDSVIPKK